MLPLKDNIPTRSFPVVTVVLIAINLIAFVWELTLSSDPGSAPGDALIGTDLSERDEATVQYGAIPFRITHPGEGCELVPASAGGGEVSAAVVCEGSADAATVEREGIPGEPVDDAPWWLTIFTSMFLHAGLLHIAGNLLFLWVFGNNIEDALGRGRFLLFYLAAGVVAAYAQALLDPSATAPAIGASGAVAGVLGAYALLHPKAKVLTMILIIFFVGFIEIPALVMLGLWFVLQALPVVGQIATVDVGADEGVAYLAHVGGFLFGLATIRAWLATRRGGEEPLEGTYLPG